MQDFMQKRFFFSHNSVTKWSEILLKSCFPSTVFRKDLKFQGISARVYVVTQ